MKAWEVAKGTTDFSGLRKAVRPDPEPGPEDVLIRIRATSLNYRDQMVVTGQYFGGAVNRDTIPLSDGAGEVVSVGRLVTRFKPGDRVAGTFFQVWVDGPRTRQAPALGVPLDGTLAEYIALHQDGVVAIPASLTFEQAATLPCAGVTAWSALMVLGNRVKPGDTVLCLGTGGVSMAAMQLAHAAGARVIITSSSEEKIERARRLGAYEAINYKRHPDWEKEVSRLTGGRGVDHVIEVGGVGTLARSYQAIGFGGKIALIGFLAGQTGEQNPYALMMKGGSLHGIGVGSTAAFEDLNRAIATNQIKPVVDKVFAFEDAADAFRSFVAGDFFGKIVITV